MCTFKAIIGQVSAFFKILFIIIQHDNTCKVGKQVGDVFVKPIWDLSLFHDSSLWHDSAIKTTDKSCSAFICMSLIIDLQLYGNSLKY